MDSMGYMGSMNGQDCMVAVDMGSINHGAGSG